MKIKMEKELVKKFKDSLAGLRIIIEKIEKIEINTRLKIDEIKDVTRKTLEGFKIEKAEDLDRKLEFLTQ